MLKRFGRDRLAGGLARLRGRVISSVSWCASGPSFELFPRPTLTPVSVPNSNPVHLHVEPAPAKMLGPLVLHRRLRTGLKEAPWSSMLMLSLVWFTWGFHLFAGGIALTFTVKRYTENPQVLSLVSTIAMLIMIGPFVSYVSDKVWTRFGRRRPFLLLAWSGASLGMLGIAFLPELRQGIDALAGCVGLPGISEMVLLVCIVVAYTTFYDLQQPVEPLFLECVPPHQRGRFFALRNIFFQAAVLFFFQLLWPNFDERIDMFGWLGAPGLLSLTGQRCVYLLAGGLFIITTAYILFCIEETKVPSAPNLRFTELGLGSFVIKYFKDVFLAKDLYPFYIVLILPMLESSVWGSCGFGPLMQEGQFGYSKAVQAQLGLPSQLLSLLLLVPLAGIYSDWQKRIGWGLRAAILALGAVSAVGVWHLYSSVAPDDIRSLPSTTLCFAIGLGVSVAAGGVFVFVIETVLDFVGREHVRAWVSSLTILLLAAQVLVTYVLISLAHEKVIPVTLYMILDQVKSAFTALSSVFIGPMIYDYIARSKMGTINSGRAIAHSSLTFLVPNLGAWWVVFYTERVNAPAHGQYDYTSVYLLQILLLVPAIFAKFYFLRMVATGRIPRTGVLEVEGASSSAKAHEVSSSPAAASGERASAGGLETAVLAGAVADSKQKA